jgi:hypothetical protein
VASATTDGWLSTATEEEARYAADGPVSRHFRNLRALVSVDGSDEILEMKHAALKILREAKKLDALTVGIANNPGTPVLEEAECPIFLETGSEPIAGSTRMNAGTAQRTALGCLSSLVMIRLGKVYAGLMVDVQASNAKLKGRREKMLLHLTGRSSEDVREALARAHGSVKLALLLLRGCDLNDAKRVLDSAGGQLRAALALLAQKRSSSASRASQARPHARDAG